MMPFLAVRCLNCNNIDEFPRMDYDEIPYCSQVCPLSILPLLLNLPADTNKCSSTSNLVPATPPSKQQSHWGNNGDDELASMFSRGLSLADTPMTPPTSPPTANFSVSQHYTHPTNFRPPTPQQQPQPSVQQMPDAAMTPTDQERAYIQYVLASNLGSAASSNDLEIALAHGIIDHHEYEHAVALNTQLRAQQQQHGGAVPGGVGGGGRALAMALDENCDAHSMMNALAAGRKAPGVDEFRNDYYGGVDTSWEDEDETAPCSVYAAGARLRPFDL